MTTPIGPSYLTAHLAMKHPVLAAGACVAAIAWGIADPNKGYVLFTFDDINMSDYSIAYPTLIDAGFPATVYVTDDNIGRDGYMGRSHLNLLNDWEIGQHSITHPHLTQLDESDMVSEIGTATEDYKSFASPFGDYNDVVIQKIKDAGYTSHVNAWSDLNGKNALPIQDAYNIHRFTVKYDMTSEDICAMAPAKDEAFILLIHKIVPDDFVGFTEWDMKQSTFEEVVNCFEGYNTTTVSKLIGVGKE